MEAIRTEYEPGIESYVVTFPGEISLNALRAWGDEFTQILQARSGAAGLLLDSNTHNFESIDCLKWLRGFLTTEPAVKSGIDRVAFIQPVQYRKPEVVNGSEAYFSTVQEAREWLRLGRRPSSK